MGNPLASLIVSTYSNQKYLELVLLSAAQQTNNRFEVIISEDAQHTHIKEFIQNLSYPLPLKHISQPDEGWQKNKALNRAIEIASTDYLVFIDEDCLLHPRFMEFHIRFASDERILAGKRIKLDQHTTQLVIEKKLWIDNLNGYILQNFRRIKRQGAKFVEEGIFFDPKGFLGFIPSLRGMYQLKGCNMSFSRNAIYAINGFDEDYKQPAIGEDIDLTWRFIKAGYKLKSLRNLAVQYHLYHKENWNNQDSNMEMMRRKQAQNQYICLNGIR